MLANALTPTWSLVPPPLQPMRRSTTPNGAKQAVSLRLHSLVDPPVQGNDIHLKASGVWVSNGESPQIGSREVTARHLALQGLLLKLELLAGSHGPQANRMLRRMTEGQLTHVYASSADFRHLVREVPSSETHLAAPAAFIDDAREWLVVDSQQAFAGTSADPSPALITSLAHLAEPSPFERRVLALSDDPRDAQGALNALLLDTARKLMRRQLGEPGITLSGPAVELAKRLGEVNLVHWLLVDLPLQADGAGYR